MTPAPPPPRLVDIGTDLVDRVAVFLHENFAARFDVETWRTLFEYPWCSDRPSSGAALVVDDRVVGVLGCVHSRRSIGGRVRSFGNICAWCVLPEYRSHSLPLLFHVTRREDMVVTNLTPTRAIEKLFRALNYEVLDTHKLFFFPILNLPTAFRRPPLRLISDPDEIDRRIVGPAAEIFRDHRRTICRHVLGTVDGDQCYVLFRRRVKKAAVFAEALHISNPDLFARHLERFLWRILGRAAAPTLAVDARFLSGRPRLALPVPRVSYCLGEAIDPGQIDNAYTELSVFPV